MRQEDMATVTATRSTTQAQTRKPARKPVRTVRLFRYGDKAVLVINQQFSPSRGQLDTYALESIPSEMGGRGFLLTKEDGSSYCVSLSGADSTCECKGHLQHGHRTVCKHLAALTALAAAGKL